MSDFGRDCAEVWRGIKKDFQEKPSGADRSVREQVLSDMDKNIEKHQGPSAPKQWPVKTTSDDVSELIKRLLEIWMSVPVKTSDGTNELAERLHAYTGRR